MSKHRISISFDGENFFWIVVDKGRFIRNPTKEDLIGTKLKSYNKTNICDRCREENRVTDNSILYPRKAYREKDKEGNETGRWVCINCWNKNYQKNDHNSTTYIKKLLRNHRTGNLDQNSETAKGIKSQELVCELYGWEDLNKKYDNYMSPLDCYDPKTGLYHQVQGHNYYSIGRFWPFGGFEREWEKIFEDMICFCISEYGNIVERIYKFPEKIVKNQKNISIFKYDSKGNVYNFGWYEEYRITDEEELKKANEIWKKILEEKK